VPKSVLIQDRIVKFKCSSAVWEKFRLKWKRKTSQRLRSLILKDIEGEV